MIGKIVILNSKDNFGKVIFEDGNESKVIKFPEHFENNDEIDISFKNNDLSGQVTKMIAHKRDNYGVVVSIFNQGIGKVLVTYPQLSGLVNFKHFSPAQQGLNLRFDIQKTINSQEAINIQVAKESEFYRCNTPTFGHIIQKNISTQESFIEDVVISRRVENLSSGYIKALREDKGFGFIADENGEDVFFLIGHFRKFYHRNPINGEDVTFLPKRGIKGMQVSYFSNGENFLPKEKQYIVVDKQKISIFDYEKVYNKEPEVGDIVYLTKSENEITLEKEHFSKYVDIFQELVKSLENKIPNYSGKITFIDDKKNYGFIKFENISVYFRAKDFINMYKEEPKKGASVNFKFKEVDNKFSVSQFIEKKQAEENLNKNLYINFVEPQKDKLYFMYKNNQGNSEIYESNMENLNEAISMYKDSKIPTKYKLDAIDTILKNKYTNIKITSEKLVEQKKMILANLIDTSTNQNNGFLALDYMSRFQEESYIPERLKKLRKVLLKEYSFIENINKSTKCIDTKEDKININFDTYSNNLSKTYLDNEFWSINIQNKEIKENNISENTWNIDLSNKKIDDKILDIDYLSINLKGKKYE